MELNARWTPAALTAALLLLYFTPWLTLGDGSLPSGFMVTRGVLDALAGLERPSASDTVSPLLAWAVPVLALAALVQCARGRTRWAGACLAGAILAIIGLGLWLTPFAGPSHRMPLDITLAGMAVLAAAVALMALSTRRIADDTPTIIERRRRDGAVALDVRQNRWRPLNRLLSVVVDAAIVFGALALWLDTHFPDIAVLTLLPIAAIAIITIGLTGAAASLAASRRTPLARIVIDDTTLTVVAGGDRGRYPRTHIGGIYVRHGTADEVDDYYNPENRRQTLTLPVTTVSEDTPEPSPVSVFADSKARVAMNLRNRTVVLARHLTADQAGELVRRLKIRLLD